MTPTHIAAVLPFRALRVPLSFTALAIGSMTPDFAVFFPLLVSYDLTHSVFGVLLVCPLIGLACHALFVTLMRAPLIALLPAWIQSRLRVPADSLQWRDCLGVLIAPSLGATTHVFWDSFTHANRWGTRLVPALNSTAIYLGEYAVPWFNALQYGFTFVLLPAMSVAAWHGLRREEPVPYVFSLSKRWKVATCCVCVIVPFAVLAWCATDAPSAYSLLGQVVRKTMAGYLALALAVSIYITAKFGTASGQLRHEPKVSERIDC